MMMTRYHFRRVSFGNNLCLSWCLPRPSTRSWPCALFSVFSIDRGGRCTACVRQLPPREAFIKSKRSARRETDIPAQQLVERMSLCVQVVSSLPARSPRLAAVLHLRRSCEFISPRVSMSSYSPPPPSDQSLDTEAPNAPVTRERRLNPDLQEQLPKPYLARALEAVDPSHPQGTKGRDPRGMSVLQQHAAFFDRNGDGVIYPWETFQGLRAIGCGFPLSFVGSILINLFLSYPTQPGWLPSPLLSIHINNIHKGKHGSDSETYDTEGRFDPSKFDAIFSKYGRTHPNALTRDELGSMLQGNRNTYDFPGWLAAAGEWLLLYSLAKDKDGLLQRETVRGLFDGSLFERLQDNKKKSS